MTKINKCSRCDQPGLCRVGAEEWMCLEHVTERINMPHNVEMIEADLDVTDFIADGGKLS